MIFFLAGIVLLGYLLIRIAPRLGISEIIVQRLSHRITLLQGLLISIIIWIPASLLTFFASASMGMWLAPTVAMNMFSLATLLGGVTLSPAGIGTTGSFLILQFQANQASLEASIVTVSLIRLSTTFFYFHDRIILSCQGVDLSPKK